MRTADAAVKVGGASADCAAVAATSRQMADNFMTVKLGQRPEAGTADGQRGHRERPVRTAGGAVVAGSASVDCAAVAATSRQMADGFMTVKLRQRPEAGTADG